MKEIEKNRCHIIKIKTDESSTLDIVSHFGLAN
jgi:hypothetical protein